MSIELFSGDNEPVNSGWDSMSDGIDQKHDPKGPALATIRQFLELTPGAILHSPPPAETTKSNELARCYDWLDGEISLDPNQQLAIAMYGLQSAVATLADLEGEEELQTTFLDGATDPPTERIFSCQHANCDFGTNLDYGVLERGDKKVRTGLYVLLPSNHYLDQVLSLGDPHEPVFFASKPDDVSPKRSTQEKEWLEDGGKAERIFDSHYYTKEWDKWYRKGQQGELPQDVYRRDRIFYSPLYNQDAYGLSGYLEITQRLLSMFLQAVNQRDGGLDF